jgi:hypothetical protein
MRAVLLLLSFLVQCFAEDPCDQRDPEKGANMCGCPGYEACPEEREAFSFTSIEGVVNAGPCYIPLEGGDCLRMSHIIILSVLFTCWLPFVVPGLVCYCKHSGANGEEGTPITPEDLKGRWIGCCCCFPACWKYEAADDGLDNLSSKGKVCVCCLCPCPCEPLPVKRDGPKTFTGTYWVSGRGPQHTDAETGVTSGGGGPGSATLHTQVITFPNTKFAIHTDNNTLQSWMCKMV